MTNKEPTEQEIIEQELTWQVIADLDLALNIAKNRNPAHAKRILERLKNASTVLGMLIGEDPSEFLREEPQILPEGYLWTEVENCP